MQVRHLQNTEAVIQIAESKIEEQPPLEEIVQSLALLAALHVGPPKAETPAVGLPKKKDDEEEPQPDPELDPDKPA
jgi:hypothetical protein